ncbi:Acetoin utilization deacetylase AcuC [Cyclobacterium lianum]|uniref:Acetoin utilization deacetylase AcuC n=1 Tax=Cyclobacterium lianum TaxID=388280 RepID=A0A1M7QKG1_9BACT|nr:histone deacetylase [Cyclobacterium lianum]SHN31647.1 Acetoin utilization deacetylase AcuC [Cyclobacterium lianum]
MLKVAWSEIYAHPLPEGHRFPMEKYELLPEQLCYEGTLSSENFFAPDRAQKKWILEVHEEAYLKKLTSLSLSSSEIRRTGFPLSQALVDREIHIMQGSIMAAVNALEAGIGMNIAGGTHHAFSDRGEGFCLLNDIAITAAHLIRAHGIQKVLVIDLDVHQGNGTASIFENNPKVFTFSMHGAHNYPLQKEKSDLDIPLKDHTGDDSYLNLLKQNLPALLDTVEPDFIIFQSGVDVLATDKLGRLGMSIQGCRERDRLVLDAAKRNQIPIMCCMGGGYARKINDIIEAHANTFRLAREIFF